MKLGISFFLNVEIDGSHFTLNRRKSVSLKQLLEFHVRAFTSCLRFATVNINSQVLLASLMSLAHLIAASPCCFLWPSLPVPTEYSPSA